MNPVTKQIQTLFGCTNVICKFHEESCDGTNCGETYTPWVDKPQCYQRPLTTYTCKECAIPCQLIVSPQAYRPRECPYDPNMNAIWEKQ